PHEGIGMKTPSQLYRASPRCLPSKLEDPSYPGHYEVRRVRSTGEVKWRGETIYLSEVLIGEAVGLVETDHHLWSLYFGPLRLGTYDEAARQWDLL
ncbi:MAG TPA: IS481 family transposase, partial [Thermoanaerobaculia bacterium]|nr:IS481 family transposase [Thermoanaerobaculia bacterium]